MPRKTTHAPTPGPWKAEKMGSQIHVTKGKAGVCLIGTSDWDWPNYAANAGLISAAPDMLHALQEIAALAEPGSPIAARVARVLKRVTDRLTHAATLRDEEN